MKGFDEGKQPLRVEYASSQQALEAGGGEGGECVDGRCKRDIEEEEEQDREEKSVRGSVY